MMLYDWIHHIALPLFLTYIPELDGQTLEVKDYVLFMSVALNYEISVNWISFGCQITDLEAAIPSSCFS